MVYRTYQILLIILERFCISLFVEIMIFLSFHELTDCMGVCVVLFFGIYLYMYEI